MKKRLVIVGILPSPIGGVSIHVMRLSAELAKKGYDVTVFDLSPEMEGGASKELEKLGVVVIDGSSISLFKLASELFKNIRRGAVVNIHTKHWVVLLLLTLIKYVKKDIVLVLTLHSLRENFSKMNFIVRSSFLFSFKKMSKMLVTNSNIKEKLLELGINHNKISIFKTFLPPLSFEYTKVPTKISLFVDNKFPIISANAFRLRFYKNEDLYGFDLCIQLVDKLKKIGYNPAFIFALPEIGEHDYYEKKVKEITELNIQHNMMVLTGPRSFIPILSISDIFIRPTNTDGDSISIRESIALNKPTVTSDVVKRPDGVVIFRNRDVDDLLAKVVESCVRIKKNKSEQKNNEEYVNDVSVDEMISSIVSI